MRALDLARKDRHPRILESILILIWHSAPPLVPARAGAHPGLSSDTIAVNVLSGATLALQWPGFVVTLIHPVGDLVLVLVRSGRSSTEWSSSGAQFTADSS